MSISERANGKSSWSLMPTIEIDIRQDEHSLDHLIQGPTRRATSRGRRGKSPAKMDEGARADPEEHCMFEL